MRDEWLQILCDPKTKAPFKLDIEKRAKEHVVQGALRSAQGETPFLIQRGVPRFVESHQAQDSSTRTIQTFGKKWTEKGKWSLGRNPAEKKLLRETFLSMMGVDTQQKLGKLFGDGQTWLNAGCGVAWSEFLFNLNTKTKRVAIDPSDAVEVAFRETKEMKNVLVCQANLFALPFQPQSFDGIFSCGVLHHTPDARAAFATLCRYLRPGGRIGIYIYCKKPFLRELADQHIREATVKMDYKDCWEFSEQMSLLGKSFQQFQKPLVIKKDVPLLGIRKGTYDLQKFIYDHFVKCFYNAGIGMGFSTLTNLDWYHPAYASHHSAEEIREWFEENGVRLTRLMQPRGWEYSGYFVSGKKTAST